MRNRAATAMPQPVGMRRVGPHRIRAFHDFHAAATIDIFRRITQTITNRSNADRLFIRL
jgi:hypothetical protein